MGSAARRMRRDAAARATVLSTGRRVEDGLRAYRCEKCGRYTITVDTAAGKVPNRIGCRASAGCGGYAPEQDTRHGWPTDAPTRAHWEWYAPDGAQMDRLQQQGGRLWAHVHNGGMLLRRRHEKQ